jgi:tRNA dimethylallyltransferase
MATKSMTLPLIVIVGPTASGKTSLAVELAAKYNGEIVCADSRTIYKYMDIGTAKSTRKEQSLVPHWGLDLVEPGERFSAADFKSYANNKIAEIRKRGRVPFLVGGTGLYIDSVLFDYGFGGSPDPGLRANLSKMTLGELHEYCFNNNVTMPENKNNKRYVIRAIETQKFTPSRRATPIDDSIIVGITTDKSILRKRIAQRIEQLFEDGVVDEAIMLGKKYGWESEALKSNIYPLIHEYMLNKMSLGDLKKDASTRDWRLAKRQLTWLRRNNYIQWLTRDTAAEYLSSRLAIYN